MSIVLSDSIQTRVAHFGEYSEVETFYGNELKNMQINIVTI